MGNRKFSNLLRVILDFVRRWRRPQDNAEHEIPNFLRFSYLPVESGQDGDQYPFKGAIKFICTNGDVWVFPDGRVIDLRPSERQPEQ